MAVSERAFSAASSDRAAELRRSAPNRTTPWGLIAAAGVVFALVGWTDVLLLWYPLRLGRPDWEFATISGTFDALPLGTIGLLLLTVALLAGGRRLGRNLLGSALLLVVLALCAAFVLFGLSFATGLGQVEGETQWILLRAGVKTAVAAAAYVILYTMMALFLFRAGRKDRAV